MPVRPRPLDIQSMAPSLLAGRGGGYPLIIGKYFDVCAPQLFLAGQPLKCPKTKYKHSGKALTRQGSHLPGKRLQETEESAYKK